MTEARDTSFTAREVVRKAVFKARKAQVAQGFYGAFPCLVGGKTEVQGAKGHVFQHGGKEQLILGVLQHKAHLAAQAVKILFVVERQ